MRIRELIFQGVLGVERPSRLQPSGAPARLDLPAGISVEAIHDLVLACLYPSQLTEDQRARLGIGDSTKIAVVLESSHGTLRIIRRADAASVRLQRKGVKGYEDVVSGASSVQTFLQGKLNLPELKVFLPLHLWRFDSSRIPETSVGSQFGDDPRIPEIVEMYLTSLQVERMEDQLKELGHQVEDGQKALGRGADVEEKLTRARAKLEEIQIDEMTEEEMELVENKEERLDEYREQLYRLRDQESTEEGQVRNLLPESPVRVPLFWAGVAIAVGAIATSMVLHENHRAIALLAIPGFILCAFQLLQYFNKMGRASIHKVKLASIRRRINQVLQDEILFRERIDHMMLHAGVEDESELQQRIPMAAKLRRIIEKLEEKLDTVRADPEYRRARKELNTVEEELEDLRRQRQELPEYVMSSFQLESDLKAMNVNPVDVRKQAKKEQDAGQQESQIPESPFGWLKSVAEWTGQWNGNGLDSAARSMWSKICGHVLSERFDDVDLSGEGNLKVGALTSEQQELWERTRSSEVHAVQVALALALHVNAHRKSGGKSFTSVWIGEPGEVMTPDHAKRFESVFRSAAKKSQIVICGGRS